MKRCSKTRTWISAVLLLMASSIGATHAASISGYMTADDGLLAYISTNDALAGTQFRVGNNWQTTYFGTTNLTPNQQYYLHVRATNTFGGAAGFIGAFTLSDPSFRFVNNTQQLLTNQTDWKVSGTGFGQNMLSATDYGANGVSPWGTRPNIAASAHWIWTSAPLARTAYFSTLINPVPIPGTLWLLGTGLIGLIGVLRKKKN